MKNETTKTPGTYKISELAKAAGVKPSTLRYYQRRGLLPVPPSPQNGGSRRYGAKDMGYPISVIDLPVFRPGVPRA